MSGYANEVGESFRSLIHVYWVRASYGVASLYVLADTADKTIKAHNIEKGNKEYNKYKVVMTTVDTITWQGLASVIIPGLLTFFYKLIVFFTYLFPLFVFKV